MNVFILKKRLKICNISSLNMMRLGSIIFVMKNKYLVVVLIWVIWAEFLFLVVIYRTRSVTLCSSKF